MPAKKQVTRDMILSAALKLLKEHGYEFINIKRLANELGCSTQPIYLSFSGMDELRSEIIPLAVKEFEKQMKDEGAGIIRLYNIKYVYCAMSEPHLFKFLFMRENAFSEIRRKLLPIIDESVKELMQAYNIDYQEADLLHDRLWMQAHGIASMIATNFCNWDIEKAEKMLEESKIVFTKKYEA